MSRRAARGYYDDNSYDSDDRDGQPRRSRREGRIENDLDYSRRKSGPPVEGLRRLSIRDRSPPRLVRDDRNSRGHTHRESPRRTSRGIDRDELESSERQRNRRRYVEEDSEEDYETPRKGGWSATAGGYDSDDEGSSEWDKRRRPRETRSPPESDYERHSSYPRRSGRHELDIEYGMAQEDIRNRRFSPSPHRSRYRAGDGEEGRMQKGAREKRDRDDGWGQDEWNRTRTSDDDYGSPRPPRAPSPELRSSRDSFDGLQMRHRHGGRRRSSNEDTLDEWQCRDHSRSSRRRLSPGSDDWGGHEGISTFRRRPRSPDRNEDAFASEWEGARQSKDARDEFEEDFSRRPSTGQTSSNDNVSEDWAMVNSPRRSRRSVQNRREDPGREIRRQRHSMERRPTPPSSERRISVDDLDRRAQIGRRYVRTKDRRERLWTEITKDLVVREAIERARYEFEETGYFYYIFEYLQPDDVSALVDLSEDIRRARRRRIHEIHRERTSLPPPFTPGGRRPTPLMLERGSSPRRRH